MKSIAPRVVYTPHYDIHFYGIERLHPFDSRKYSRAWHTVLENLPEKLKKVTLPPPHPATEEDLLLVHTRAYLDELKLITYLVRALEFPALKLFPYGLIKQRLIGPMLWATQGTITAAFEALQHGIAVNLSGGYHHASAARGEGFCLFADVPIAIAKLRQSGLLAEDDHVLIIDLDAHQGNGYARVHHGENSLYILDMYNQQIFPGDDHARRRINRPVRLLAGTDTETYLKQLRHHLPAALKDGGNIKLAFYIAGTDIYEHDQLGLMKVSEEGIFERDKFVFDTLTAAGIPWAMVLGGGYSSASYRFIARSVRYILDTWG